MKLAIAFALLVVATSAYGWGMSGQTQNPSPSQLKQSSLELEDALRKIQMAEHEIAQQKEMMAKASGEPGFMDRLKHTLTPSSFQNYEQHQQQQHGSGQSLADSLREKAHNILPSSLPQSSDVQQRFAQMIEQAKASVGVEQHPTFTQRLKEMMGQHEPTFGERAASYAENVKGRISDAVPSLAQTTSMLSPKPASLKDRIAESLRNRFGISYGAPESPQQKLHDAWDSAKFKVQDTLRPVYDAAAAKLTSSGQPAWIGPRHYNAYRQLQLVESSLPKDEDAHVRDFKSRIRTLVDQLGREETKANELYNLRAKVKNDAGWLWYFYGESRLKVDEINTLIRDTERSMESVEDDIHHMLNEVKPYIGVFSRMFIRDVFSIVPSAFRVLAEGVASVAGFGLFSLLVGGPTVAALIYGLVISFGPQLTRLLAGVPAFGIASWSLLKLPSMIIEYGPNIPTFLVLYTSMAAGLVALATVAARSILRAMSMTKAEVNQALQKAKAVAAEVLPAGSAPISSILPEGVEGVVEKGPGGPSMKAEREVPASAPPPSMATDTTGKPYTSSGEFTREQRKRGTATAH
jgi:hypothetical protein